MPDYYDTVYRQVIKEILSKHIRPYDEKEEKVCEFSWAILARERYAGATGLTKRIEYDVVENESIVCGIKNIKQQTDFISFQIDVYRLSNSYYLVEQAKRITFQLCNAKLYDFIH
jgi:hypothetical protein